MSRERAIKNRQLRSFYRNRCDKIVLSEEDVFVYSDLKDPDVYYCLTKEEKDSMSKTLEEEGYKEPELYDNDKCQNLFFQYKGNCKKASKNYKGFLTILEQKNQFLNRKEITQEELRQLLFFLSKHDNVYDCFTGRKKYELFCLRNKQTDPGHQYVIDLNKYMYQIYLELINIDESYTKHIFRQLYLLFTKKRTNNEEEELKEGVKILFSYIGFNIQN